MTTLLAHNKKRIYTVNDGTYKGFIQNRICYLKNDEDKIFYSFDCTKYSLKALNVKVIVECPNAKIYLEI